MRGARRCGVRSEPPSRVVCTVAFAAPLTSLTEQHVAGSTASFVVPDVAIDGLVADA
jgi:hypothetical protein